MDLFKPVIDKAGKSLVAVTLGIDTGKRDTVMMFLNKGYEVFSLLLVASLFNNNVLPFFIYVRIAVEKPRI